MGLLDRVSDAAPIISVSAFVIQEITHGSTGGLLGDVAGAVGAGKAARKLQLTGRGLPHRPFSLTTSQRLSLTWLPGYATATAQPLGAKEDVTTIRGKWSDKYLAYSADADLDLGPLGNAFAGIDNAIGAAGAAVGLGSSSLGGAKNELVPVEWRGQRVGKVYQAAEIIDEIVRTAMFVEVLWDQQARRGFLTKFHKDFLNAHDLEWEMEFTWISRADPNPPVTAPELSLGDTVSLFQTLSDALNLEALPPTFPMANDILRDIDQGIKRIASVTQAIADTVGNIADLALSPFNVARSMVALLDTMRGQVDALNNRLTALPAPGLHTNRAGSSVSANQQTSSNPAALRSESLQSFGSSAVASEYVTRVRAQLKLIKSAALLQKDDFLKKIEREVTAVVTAREGQDLRDIAAQFYGAPQEWKRIATANGLVSAKLTAGLSIVIPKYTAGEGC